MAEVVELINTDGDPQRANNAYEVRYVRADTLVAEATTLPLTLGCATVLCPE